MSALPDITITMEAHVAGLDRYVADFDRQVAGGGSGSIRDCFAEQWPATYFAAMADRFNRYAHGGGDWAPLSPRTIMARRGEHRTKAGVKLRLGKLDPETQKEARALIAEFKRDMLDDLDRERGALPKKPRRGHDDPDAEERSARQALAGNYGRLRAYNEMREGGTEIPTARQTAAQAVRPVEEGGGGVAILMDTSTLFKSLTLNTPAKIVRGVRYGVEVGLGPGEGHAGRGKDNGMTIGRLAWIHQTGSYRGGHPRTIIVPPDSECQAKLNAQLDAAIITLQRQHGLNS